MANYEKGLRLSFGRQEKGEPFKLLNFEVTYCCVKPGREWVVAKVELKALSELLIGLERLFEILSLPNF